MARRLFYNKALVTLSVDGVPQVDLGDEDTAIMLERPDDLSELTVGVDSATTSLSRNPTGIITVTYRPNSPSLTQIEALYLIQQSDLATLFTLAITTGVDETVIAWGCSISSLGSIDSGGKVIKTRTVVFKSESVQVVS